MTTLDITAGAIITDICSQDEQIIRKHALNLGKKEQSQVSRYLKLRKQLLKQKGREGKLISEAEGDRRDYYKAARAALLMQKYITGKPKRYLLDGTVATKFLISPIASGLGTIAHTITAATTATASVLTGGASERTRRNSNAEQNPPNPKEISTAPLSRHASTESIENNNNSSGSKTPERKLTKSNSSLKGSTDSLESIGSQASTSSAPTPEVSLSPIRQASDGVADAYAFQGMLTVFQEHNEPVTIVRFANEDKSLLAFCSQDAKISICQILPNPKLIRALQGHLEAVTDFRWSMTNDIIISSSMDKTVKVWAVRNGECIRTVEEKAPCTAVCFHPLNNNHFVYGTAKGTVQVVNVSTGKILQKVTLYQNKVQQFQPFKVPIAPTANVSVNALDFDSTGSLLYVGDSKGCVHTFSNDAQTGILQYVGRTQVSSRAINAIEFHLMRLKSQAIPTLLVNCCDSSIKLYKTNPKPTPQVHQLTLDKQLPIVNMQHSIKSHFCPLLSNRDGVCVVSGSEDGLVHIFDVTKDQNQAINQLQGHSGVVYDAAWNYDETVLATCDAKGTVICWKRVKEVAEQ